MKNIKSLLFLAFALMLAWPLQAQEEYPWFDAGGNRVVLQSVTNVNKVLIGLPDTNKGVCYEWTGPNIVDEYGNISNEGHTPQIYVIPRLDTMISTYKVVRYSNCGGEQSKVRVLVQDSISISLVQPLRECYLHGDSTEIWQFVIVTRPPNCHTLAKVDQKRVYNHEAYSLGQTHGHDTLTFSLTFNNKTCVYPGPNDEPVVVDVYDDNLAPTDEQISFDDIFNISLPKSTDNSFVKSFQDFITAIKRHGEGMFDHLADNGGLNGKPDWKPKKPFTFTFSLNVGPCNQKAYKTCCNGFRAEAAEIAIAPVTISFDFSGRAGCPGLYVPGLGGLYGEAGVFGGAQFTPFTIKLVSSTDPTNKWGCNDWSPCSLNIYLGGKVYVGAAIVDPAVIDFKVGVEPKLETRLVINDLRKKPPVLVTVSLNAMFDLIGFNIWRSSWNLYKVDLTTGKITLFDN